MQTNITFRNLSATEALKSYAKEKLERVHKYLDQASEAHVVLAVERHLHHADITVHAGQFFLRGREASDDLYASIDLAMDKIERQLKRYKEKLKERRAAPHHNEGIKVRHAVVEVADAVVEHRVVKSTELPAKPMSVDEAVMQMDLIERDFLIFQNAQSHDINVIYRRKDGNYGLIEAKSQR
jgi:putative sigma-54 modulation protein